MIFLKKYEYWTSNVTDNFDVNYGHEEQKLSEDVIEILDFTETNFDKIDNSDLLNNTTEFRITFKNGLEYEEFFIRFEKDKVKEKYDKYILSVIYRVNNEPYHYNIYITKYEFDYLHRYFSKIHNFFKRKEELKNKEERKLKFAQHAANKYNI